ncbi:MAG: SMC-Scp complex subunit ScpB [Fibromonadaceae bacterium]|jgi:segregation and condensation protein B|nr:SMC-Scp complex subunit ScpB [Fibromonadaceae bacterium]
MSSEDIQEEQELQSVSDLPPIESVEELSSIIQALVFASTEVVTLKKLKDILGDFLDQSQVSGALRHANEQLAKIKSPFEIVAVAGGYRFRTKNAYYPYIRKLFPENNARRLSAAALETLAIVAYKQPITKAGIEAVRGVSCDGPLHSLLDKKFIALGERAETVGNPYTYITTTEFLKYFGINQIPDDLPRLTEFSDILNSDFLIPQYPLQKQPEPEPVHQQETTEQLEIPLESD